MKYEYEYEEDRKEEFARLIRGNPGDPWSNSFDPRFMVR